MQISLDRAGMQQIAEAWSDFFDMGFRKNSPLLPHLGFTPPHYADIPKLLDDLFLYVRSAFDGRDAESRAARIHNGIVYIYPFAEHSEMIARAAMQYELMHSGLPVVDIGLSEQEYNTLVSESIKEGDDKPLAAAISKAVRTKQMAMASYGA
jgi:Fic family protein